MKIKVLNGKHQQRDKDGKLRTYRRGQILESNIDLAKRFNRRGTIKFRKVAEEAEVSQVPADGEAPKVEDMLLDEPSEEEVLDADLAEAQLDERQSTAVDSSLGEDEIQDVYSEMGFEDLKTEAESLGIDTKGANSKKALRSRIRAKIAQ